MRHSPSTFPRPGGRAAVVTIGVLAGAVALLTACGGGAAGGSATSGGATPTSSTSAGGNSNGANAVDRPAASGKIAEIDGNTLQVQSDDSGQVAVAVTDKTTYTQMKSATLAAIKIGSCIVASSPASSDDQSATQPTAITADEVTVTSAVNGSCTRGFGAAPGGATGPRGSFTGAPSNFQRPSGAPSGTNGQFRRALGTAGVVTAVHGNTLTVKSERRDFPSSATPSPTGSSTTTTVTVTVTSTTKYTATVTATKAALKVGLCLTATGTTGSDGTVSATRVALSPATSTGCGQTFRRGFAGGGPGGAGTVTSGG